MPAVFNPTPEYEMNRSTTHRLASSAIAAVLAAAAMAVAAQTTPSAATATAAAPMNFQQVVERIVAQGYADVREIERKSDKLYEIDAHDAKGRRVELTVDARSGEVLREKVKR